MHRLYYGTSQPDWTSWNFPYMHYAPVDIEVLEGQLQEWLGDDWKQLVDNPAMQQAKARRKKGIFG